MSASSHTRDHHESVDFTRELLVWRILVRYKVRHEPRLSALPSRALRKHRHFCPTSEKTSSGSDRQSLFELREGFDDPIIKKYIEFMRANGIDIAGIEFIEDKDGNKITYDVNGTTNYSPGVEEGNGLNGMAAVVRFLAKELFDCTLSKSPGLPARARP